MKKYKKRTQKVGASLNRKIERMHKMAEDYITYMRCIEKKHKHDPDFYTALGKVIGLNVHYKDIKLQTKRLANLKLRGKDAII